LQWVHGLVGSPQKSPNYAVDRLAEQTGRRLGQGAELLNCSAWTTTSSKREARIQGYGPNDIRPHHAEPKGHCHYVEQCKKDESIGEKTAADNELGVPAEKQKQI
jgi:hypothetical protein